MGRVADYLPETLGILLSVILAFNNLVGPENTIGDELN